MELSIHFKMEHTIRGRVYRDASYSERWPWVIEIDGEIATSASDKAFAVAMLKDYAVDELTDQFKERLKAYTQIQQRES